MIAETVARPRVEGRMAIAELGALYIANARRRGRKRSTLLNIENYARVHFEPFFGDRPVDAIEPGDVIRLMGKLERDGKTPKTIRNILATLSALFNFAVAPHRRYAAVNPCTGIELPAAPEPEEIRFLTLEQVDLLLVHVRPGILAHLDRPLFLAAVMTGMRKGELVALRWRDVDFTAGRVRVRRNYTCGEFGTPKTRRSTRSIPLARMSRSSWKLAAVPD
jgi:integrase